MGGYAGGSRRPRAEPRRHWLSLPSAFPAGGAGGAVACLPCRCGTLRGGLPALPPAYPAFGLPFCPPSPQPPSPAGKGETYSFLMQGASPLASPGLNCLRHLQNLPSRCPAGGGLPWRHWLDLPIRHSTGMCLRHRQFGAKPIETPFFGQCRQPRRGGTGGEELRRLRWSSPPGQGEPVPPGASPPQGTTVAESSGNKKIPPPQQIPEWQDKADGARGHTPLPPARLINHLWYRVPRSI